MKDEIRIGIRSGHATAPMPEGTKPIKVAFVSGGVRPMLWFGDGTAYGGLAWISGRDTLRRIRDALTEALGEEGRGTR